MELVLSCLVLRTLHGFAAWGPEPGEVVVAASTIRFVQTRLPETVLRGRPWVPFPRIGTLAAGARLVVRGEVQSRDPKGCQGAPWYAIWPQGFVCSTEVRPSEQPPAFDPVLPLSPGDRLPFAYAMVRADDTPSHASREAMLAGDPPRPLHKGMALAIQRTLEIDGERYVQALDGRLVARTAVGFLGQGSTFHGLDVRGLGPGPALAWTLPDKTAVTAAPTRGTTAIARLPARTVVVPRAQTTVEGERFVRTDAGWIRARDLAEVVIVVPPPAVLEPRTRTPNRQWIDVDLGEQVLVAYQHTDPIFATLISSGRATPTPLGDYAIWAKVATMDMDNQAWEDAPYMVQGVPWVLLFQGHNALHGAYWHDRFGHRKSHGCINLAPADARWLFEWVAPPMTTGHSGAMPAQLADAVVVHVRDSSRPPGQTFTQERPPGPPDREEEQKKLAEAEQRRALMEALKDTERPPALQVPTEHPFGAGGDPLEPSPVPDPDPRPDPSPPEPATDGAPALPQPAPEG